MQKHSIRAVRMCVCVCVGHSSLQHLVSTHNKVSSNTSYQIYRTPLSRSGVLMLSGHGSLPLT